MSRKRIEQIAAAGGIGFVVLEGLGQVLIQVGGMEPEFRAPANEIAAYFLARNETLFNWGGYLTHLSFLALIWFLGALWLAMRSAERAAGDSALLSLISFGSGLLALAPLTGGGWPMAVFRIGEGLDPEVAQTLFDLGNFGFATSWVFFGGTVLAAGLGALQYKVFSRRLGWFSIVVAVLLLIARIIWTTQVAFLPWVLFWIWLIVVSVVLIRRAGNIGEDRTAS
jgi:hypothetical protein